MQQRSLRPCSQAPACSHVVRALQASISIKQHELQHVIFQVTPVCSLKR